MADKRISDLEATISLEEDTLFHVRKTSENEDFKITKTNIVKSLGNTVVNGFVATSQEANKLVLTPSNGAYLDQYYEGMIIQFLSPINSSDLVQIKIGNLSYIHLKTNFINPITFEIENSVLQLNTFYEAIYKNGIFIQINIDRNYTNEYLANGQILYDLQLEQNYTQYTLTSATGYYKKKYYEGMSVVFTSGIIENSQENMSDGKVYINVDNLGLKELSDPNGDGVPFSLQPNETIMGIYDGEKFIKNMFSMQEPDLPVPIDPDNLPPGYDITIYVGPDEEKESNRTLQTCFDTIIKDYGDGGGRKVLIKFRDNYNGMGLSLANRVWPNYYNWSAFITIEGNPNITMQPALDSSGAFSERAIFLFYKNSNENKTPAYINLTGSWKVNFPILSANFSNAYSFINFESNGAASHQVFIKNAVIRNVNEGNQNYSFIRCRVAKLALDIKDSEIINFGEIFSTDTSYGDITCIANNLTITNNLTQTRQFPYLLAFYNYSYTLINLIVNIYKPSNYSVLIVSVKNMSLQDSTIVLSEPLGGYIVSMSNNAAITNCTIKYANNVNNTKGSVSAGTTTAATCGIYGNDFTNPNSASIPDILVQAGTLLLKSGTLGSTKAINGAKIQYV
jgi:hypothetical protein